MDNYEFGNTNAGKRVRWSPAGFPSFIGTVEQYSAGWVVVHIEPHQLGFDSGKLKYYITHNFSGPPGFFVMAGWGELALVGDITRVKKTCDCGAVKCKTTHASWCSSKG